MDIAEARRAFDRLEKKLEVDPVIRVRRHGSEVFAVVDCDYLTSLLETLDVLSDPDAAAQMRQSAEDVRAGRVVDHEALKRELS